VILTLIETDPLTNLATEKCLFDDLTDDMTLLLWRNDPSLVVGRHQNPWVECNLDQAGRAGIPVVRRTSGGGTVYHDQGNMNFSFIAIGRRYDLDWQFGTIIDGLDLLGIEAIRTARNDLVVGGRKVSGNAFRHARGRSLHHGTLLFAARLDDVDRYLRSPDAAAISSNAISSVPSEVMNLNEIRPGLDFDELAGAIRRSYVNRGGSTGAGWQPNPNALLKTREELGSWEWRFGRTPRFTRTITHDLETFTVTVNRGRIETIATAPAATSHTVPGDDRIPALDDLLRGTRYVRSEIESIDRPDSVSEMLRAVAESARV